MNHFLSDFVFIASGAWDDVINLSYAPQRDALAGKKRPPEGGSRITRLDRLSWRWRYNKIDALALLLTVAERFGVAGVYQDHVANWLGAQRPVAPPA
ncbi:hypothetical protein [Pandoraea horticolens]|uniref:hypothetical protein n=1 Tax=Pandoraea horticolens TaxID=2508298 RepID=UPI00123FFD7B|nr:hypothetical protein [Pandoraea horticolens]